MPYFVQGLTMGLAYVAPIGVQNLFVIHSAPGPSRGAGPNMGSPFFLLMTWRWPAFLE